MIHKLAGEAQCFAFYSGIFFRFITRSKISVEPTVRPLEVPQSIQLPREIMWNASRLPFTRGVQTRVPLFEKLSIRTFCVPSGH